MLCLSLIKPYIMGYDLCANFIFPPIILLHILLNSIVQFSIHYLTCFMYMGWQSVTLYWSQQNLLKCNWFWIVNAIAISMIHIRVHGPCFHCLKSIVIGYWCMYHHGYFIPHYSYVTARHSHFPLWCMSCVQHRMYVATCSTFQSLTIPYHSPLYKDRVHHS